MSASETKISERIARLSDKKRALLEARLAMAKKEKNTGIPKCKPRQSYPLSFSQERLWFLSQLEPDSAFYNEAGAVEFNGQVDSNALNWSINQIVRRHEILRTTIIVTDEGQPQQSVLQDSTVTIKHIDLQQWSKQQRLHEVQRLMTEAARQPFDLAVTPPFKIILIQLDSDKYILLFVLHHIIADQWSIRLLIQELGVFYDAYFNGQRSPLPQLPIQYADYACWQREQLQGIIFDNQLTYWRQQMAGAAPLLELPTDLPRPPIQSYRGKKYHFDFPQGLMNVLSRFSKANSATLFMTLVAVFAACLYRYTGQKDICIGYPVANRTRSELQNMMGFFANTLVLRADFSDNPHFATLLTRIRHAVRKAQANQDLPFEALVDALSPVRDTTHNPLFQVMFVFQSDTGGKLELPGIESRLFEIDSGGAKFDVTLCISEEKGALTAWFEYNTDLFIESTMVRWAGHYRQLLEAAIAQPEIPLGTLDYQAPEERQQLLVDWNETRVDYLEGQCIHSLFEEHAVGRPDAIAVVFNNQQLTYGQLNIKANQLAHYLRGQGVGPDRLVGICVERSLEMVIGILGILKAGGAYVSLDPNAPRKRLFDVLDNTQPVLVLIQEKLQALLPSDVKRLCLDTGWNKISEEETDNVACPALPQHLAYVLYTSGSTGKPKGVAVTHHNVVNSTLARRDYYQAPVSCFLLLSSMTFDSSIAGLFGTLSQGGCLILPQDDAILDARHLVHLITSHEVSHFLTVPSLYKAILGRIATKEGKNLKAVIVAGEPCHKDLVDLHYQRLPQTKLFNEYGPTEATVWSTVYQCGAEQDASIPIGRPIANTQIYLLDAYLNPVSVGVTGELYIGGVGLARGYLNNSGLAAERFVPNPFSKQPGVRLYRTGDLARYRTDGNIEYLGRTDHQVKIRGFRIELGEIEAALLQHELLKEAVVTAPEDSLGNKQLVAYVVSSETEPNKEKIRKQLKMRLPDYMIPAVFVFLDRFPLTANGKIDRERLPIPDISEQLTHEYVAPRNMTEETLVGIWSEVLGVEKIGIHDNFFELGGDSILSIQIISRAQQSGIVITPKVFFQHQTVGDLVENINSDDRGKEDTAEQGLITGSVPLVPIQRWFFEQALPNPHHWNQSVLLEVQGVVDVDAIAEIVEQLEQHHDVLRSRFFQENGRWCQSCVVEKSQDIFQQVDLSTISDGKQQQVIEAEAAKWQKSLDLCEGPIWRVVWFDLGKHQAGRLLIVIHHLVVDGVSWRILLEDLQTCYRQVLIKEQSAGLPDKTTSFLQWAKSLSDCAVNGMFDDQVDYWQRIANKKISLIPVDDPYGSNVEALSEEITVTLSQVQTDILLREVPAAYHTQINDILLSALLQTLCDWANSDSILINLEGHGREDVLFEGLDVSRTVGWFTSNFPVLLTRSQSATLGHFIKSIKEQLRGIPNKGLGYGLLRHLSKLEITEQMVMCSQPQVSFNYLGQFDQTLSEDSPFILAKESAGPEHEGTSLRSCELDISARVIDGKLNVSWTYGTKRYRKETVDKLADAYFIALKKLIQHCSTLEKEEFTPSDFPLAQLSQTELDAIMRKQQGNIEDIYPLVPLQQGLIFHSLYAPESGMYCNQFSCTLTGDLDITKFIQAWEYLVANHPVLRTAFLMDARQVPLQVVCSKVDIPVERLDWRKFSVDRQVAEWQDYLVSDRNKAFAFDQAPLMRLALIQCAKDSYYFLWTHHHVLLDGWCTSIIFKEIFAIYDSLSQGREVALEPSRPYCDYIAWLQNQDQKSAENYWRSALSGFSTSTSMGIVNHKASNTANSNNLAAYTATISPNNTIRLVNFAKNHQLTLNTLIQGAWALLLGSYSGERDVVFGITVSGRPAELAGVERMIGLFINTVPLRVKMAPEICVLDWLAMLFKQNQTIRQYEYAPLVDIQGWSEITPGQPLFESLLVFENFPVDWTVETQAEKIGMQDITFTEQANYPLTITAAHIPEKGLVLRFEYQANLFEESTIIHMAGHFQQLLESITSSPNRRLADLSLLTDSERKQLLLEWNATETEYSRDQCIHQLFEAQVEKSPEAVAVVFEGQQLTYEVLNARANQLAHYLRTKGVGAEVLVGICVERSLEMVIGILGILKAGGAYMPIDSCYPRERVTFMLKDAQPALSLVHTATRDVLLKEICTVDLDVEHEVIAQYNGDNLSYACQAQNLAYVIFTSGSTGKPKGSALVHHGAVNRLEWMRRRYRLEASDKVLQKTPLSFDVSVLELFCPLVEGARLVVAPPGAHKDAMQLAEIIKQHEVTVLHFVPSMLAAFLDVTEAAACKSLRHVICIGEALSASLQRSFFNEYQATGLDNIYGPVEASIIATEWACERESEDTVVPIGRPIADTQIYLLDAFLNPAPVGVACELYIGGVGVARGYQNRSALTAERFIPNPFSQRMGERLYRTGDLGRYQADGNIEYLGRTDRQVKVRGFRIELGEIEASLLQHEQIKEAVAMVREDNPEDRRLVAYIIGNEITDTESIRTHLKTRLPDYMIPVAFVFLDSLPLTSNGKIDHKMLSIPDATDQLTHEYVAPRNPTEEILAGIWAEVLGIEKIGTHDNFFELGGDSLLVMQVVARIKESFVVNFSLKILFENPTISMLSEIIKSIYAKDDGSQVLPITAVPRSSSVVLSHAQERLWFLDQFESNNSFYNIEGAIRLIGKLDVMVLKNSLNEIICRHEVLRTTFDMHDGQPMQVIKPVLELDIAVKELNHMPEDERKNEIARYLMEETRRPFDLAQGPLVRATLLSLGSLTTSDRAEYILFFSMHHIVSDGWSTGILIREFVTLYESFRAAGPAPLPELKIQYADYAAWQREWLQGEQLVQQLDYWKQQLSGSPEILKLPEDHSRPTAQSYRGASYRFMVSQNTTKRLKKLGRQEEVTLFMVLLAGFNILLSRYSGQYDICIGTPVANRNRIELETLIGFFVNTMVLRTDLTGNPTLIQFLKKIKKVCLDAQAHQDLPFERLVEELAPIRDMSHSPLFQVMLALQNTPKVSLEIDGLQVAPVDIDTCSVKFDLDLEITERTNGLDATFNYNTDLFEESTIIRMAGHFQKLLEEIVLSQNKPLSDLSILTVLERDQILLGWNATETMYSEDQCIHQLFEAQVARSPDSVAIVFKDQQLTYRQLNAKANQLAHYLRAQGVGPEILVGICVERSLEMSIGILGILKAGSAYVPIDPGYPQERIAFILEDTQSVLTLTHSATQAVLAAGIRTFNMDLHQEELVQYSEENPLHTGYVKNLAYVIYTSGSTGKPKGAGLAHQGVVNRLEWMQCQYKLDTHDRILQKTPFSFDVSVWELLWSVLVGARLVMAPPEAHKDGMQLAQMIQDHEITTIHFVPSMLSAFLDVPDVEACRSLQRVICSGEALSVSLQKRFFEKFSAQLHNLYGPTEASIDVTMWACEKNRDDTVIPIGRPIANTQIYLLDAYLNPVPTGVSGELYIGGVGLARGYQNRSALTAERFIPDPFNKQSGERIYRTGDLGRYREDGNIEYLGRADHQVKIRGFRVELGEIEAALLQEEQIEETVAIVREDNPENKRLVAYIIGNELALDLETIRTHLRTRLPDYMIPTAFVFLNNLPLTANGKLDRKALPAPNVSEQLTRGYVAPRNPIEEILTDIWVQVLGVEKVGVYDNFFELGGHSLLVVQVVSRIHAKLKVKIPLQTMFKEVTVETLAKGVEAAQWLNKTNTDSIKSNADYEEFEL